MNYQKPLAHYAQTYNRSLSTIKRYAREDAPLDDPSLMKYFLVVKKDTGRAGRRGSPRITEGHWTATDCLRAIDHRLNLIEGSVDTLAHATDLSPKAKRQVESFKAALHKFSDVFIDGFTAAGIDMDAEVVGVEPEWQEAE